MNKVDNYRVYMSYQHWNLFMGVLMGFPHSLSFCKIMKTEFHDGAHYEK